MSNGQKLMGLGFCDGFKQCLSLGIENKYILKVIKYVELLTITEWL